MMIYIVGYVILLYQVIPILSQTIQGVEAIIFTVATAKDVLHIDEWIDYHRILGYKHFYIVDTAGMYSELNLIHDGAVTLLTMSNGMSRRLRDMYDAFPKLFQNEDTLCTFLAVSDFIVLRNHSTIQEVYTKLGERSLLAMPCFETVSNEAVFYPEAILKRATLRTPRPTSYRYSAVLSNIAGFEENLRPIVKENSSSETPDLDLAPVAVFSTSLLTRQEHRWYRSEEHTSELQSLA